VKRARAAQRGPFRNVIKLEWMEARRALAFDVAAFERPAWRQIRQQDKRMPPEPKPGHA
jgi:hypothetical protein